MESCAGVQSGTYIFNMLKVFSRYCKSNEINLFFMIIIFILFFIILIANLFIFSDQN